MAAALTTAALALVGCARGPEPGVPPIPLSSSAPVAAPAAAPAGTAMAKASAAVADLRARVWMRLTDTVPPVPAGTAFGLHALGFLRPAPEARAEVHALGPWTRVSTDRGFVIAR